MCECGQHPGSVRYETREPRLHVVERDCQVSDFAWTDRRDRIFSAAATEFLGS